jgi:hypothetical protein
VNYPWNYLSVGQWYIISLIAATIPISFFPSNRIACSLEELSHVIVGSSVVSAEVCTWQVLLLYRMGLFTQPLTSTFIILARIFNIAFLNIGSTYLRGRAKARSVQRP